jgi:hypothetical protein
MIIICHKKLYTNDGLIERKCVQGCDNLQLNDSEKLNQTIWHTRRTRMRNVVWSFSDFSIIDKAIVGKNE